MENINDPAAAPAPPMSRLRTEEIVYCAVFAALIAVGSFIRIPIPGLPVPFTLQTLFTILAGAVLGKRLGALAVAVYVFAGLAGAPLFTAGGGPGYVFHPTFGYLLGFIGGAWLGGFICGRAQAAAAGAAPSFRVFLAAGLANLAVVYLCGLTYYYIIANWYLPHARVGVWVLLLQGCLFTLPGDIVICAAAAKLARKIFAAGFRP